VPARIDAARGRTGAPGPLGRGTSGTGGALSPGSRATSCDPGSPGAGRRGATTAVRRAIISATRAEGAGLDTPAGRAWESFLRAHAGLMRVLDTELRRDAGLGLNDFDVLVQLGVADGSSLRMSELARRTLVSRSGTTRRVEQLEGRGLVARAPADTDRRTVVVCLTGQGVEVLQRAVAVHARGIAEHFVRRLTATDVRAMSEAMEKVVIDCDFG
jgi:DNA-binding MarR family transcriptional regulator